MISKAPGMKKIIDKLYFVNIKHPCSVKDKGTVKRMERQATNWAEIFAIDTSDQGLLHKTRVNLTTP